MSDESIGNDVVDAIEVKVGGTNTIRDVGTLKVMPGSSLVSNVVRH